MSDETHDKGLSRRELLKRAGVGAAAVGVGGGAAPYAFAGPHRYRHKQLKGDLSIIQWIHFVPDYDTWFDKTWVTQWGQKNDVQVTVDHIANTQLPARAAAEVAAQSGHDIFGFLAPPAAYEDQVINHAPVVQEIQRKVGKMGDLALKSTYNPKTKKYFGVSDNYVPDPVVWRHDLWNGVGETPSTWDHVRRAAPKQQVQRKQDDCDDQREREAREAPSVARDDDLQPRQQQHRSDADAGKRDAERQAAAAHGESDEIFGWNPASNNQFLYAGRGSLILNAISATRTPEDLNLPFVNDLWIYPIPKGPHGRIGLEHVMGVYSIWKFAKNKEAAQKFLADLCINYKQATTASKLYNFPSFPGAYPLKQIYKAAAADTHKPRGKYTVLTTIAAKYTHNVGYPGYSNAAIDEMFNKYLIPVMFSDVSQGKKTAEQSMRDTNAQMKQIWAKWKAQGKI